MKSGSIVVVFPHESDIPLTWRPIADGKTLYMVDSVITGMNEQGVIRTGCTFIEGKITAVGSNTSLAIDIAYIKEILPPQDISILAMDLYSKLGGVI